MSLEIMSLRKKWCEFSELAQGALEKSRWGGGTEGTAKSWVWKLSGNPGIREQKEDPHQGHQRAEGTLWKPIMWQDSELPGRREAEKPGQISLRCVCKCHLQKTFLAPKTPSLSALCFLPICLYWPIGSVGGKGLWLSAVKSLALKGCWTGRMQFKSICTTGE